MAACCTRSAPVSERPPWAGRGSGMERGGAGQGRQNFQMGWRPMIQYWCHRAGWKSNAIASSRCWGVDAAAAGLSLPKSPRPGTPSVAAALKPALRPAPFKASSLCVAASGTSACPRSARRWAQRAAPGALSLAFLACPAHPPLCIRQRSARGPAAAVCKSKPTLLGPSACVAAPQRALAFACHIMS